MLAHRAMAEEQMDAADLDSRTYERVVHDLARVNSVTLARRPTLHFLRTGTRNSESFRLLDVGYGDGDMLRAIWRWARRRGLRCSLVGIDLNPRSQTAALSRHPAGADIEYRTGDYRSLAGEGWDFIISSLVTHHMTDDERTDFLDFMDREATTGWFVNDLHRHGLAWAGFPLLARLLGVHDIVRQDGQLSIARSFRPAEWHAMLAAAPIRRATVRRYFPFRLCVGKIHS